MRSLRQLREKGADSFFEPRPTRKGGPIFTPNVLQQAQQYQDQGMTPNEAANELDILSDTFRKAINDGRLKIKSELITRPSDGSTKSARDIIDACAAEVLAHLCQSKAISRQKKRFLHLPTIHLSLINNRVINLSALKPKCSATKRLFAIGGSNRLR